MGIFITDIIDQTQKNLAIIESCITEIKNNDGNVPVALERQLIEAFIKLGEAQTFLVQDEPCLVDLKSLRQKENPEFTVAQGFVFYRNHLTHHYPYQRHLGQSAPLEKAIKFAQQYLQPFAEKIDALSKSVDATQTIELELSKENKQPRANDRKYSIGDYLLFASREITELKKFLDEHQVILYSPEQLFSEENGITTTEAAKAEFETNIASNPRLLSTVENFIRNICTFLKEYNFIHKNLSETSSQVSDYLYFDKQESLLSYELNPDTYDFLTSGAFITYRKLAHELTEKAEFEEYIYLIAYIKNLHSSSYLQGLIQHCNQRQSLKCSVVLKPESANINTKIDFREQLQKEAKLIQSQEDKNSSAKTEQSDSSTSEPPAKRQKKTDNSNETNDAGISNPISEDGDGIQSNTTIEDKSLLPTFRSP